MLLKSGNSKMIVGYDLGRTWSQISYYSADTSKVETAPSVAGTQIYQIPTALCKRYGTNQWLFGREAVKAAEADEGILVDNLLELAVDGEPVQIDGETYEPVTLLTLFIKKSLSLLAAIGSVDRIGAFLITCEAMDAGLIGVLENALAGVSLKARYICFQSYEESFYQYMLHQNAELMRFQTLMLQYDAGKILLYRLHCNERTNPKAAFVEREEYPFARIDASASRQEKEQMDTDFTKLAAGICGEERISSIYLIGDAFNQDWMKKSLRFLCQGRRVFLGSNLFSQGACLGMMERIRPSETAAKYAFLGTGKLKANVGMKALRNGMESYCALLNAGVNWYEAVGECEFYLQEEKAFELVIQPLNDAKGKIAQMFLDGMPEGMCRVYLKVEMVGEDVLAITAKDLGFGEFRPATQRTWREEINLYQ